MEFHVLDEVLEIEGAGLMLLAAEEDCACLYAGCRIRDSRGNAHTVESVGNYEGLAALFIRGDHAAYFRRLFRDVFVDATLFRVEETGAEP